MTTFLLIRHGDTDAIGNVMAGWTPGWHLNDRGRKQVERLAEKLSKIKIRAVYASPLERAIETAEPIARKQGLGIETLEELGEIRIGEWEGRSMAELERREDWRRFNRFRSGARAPGGEMMTETQARMIRQLECLRSRHPEDAVAVVSHGDPLRSVVAYYLGTPIDLAARIEISPASLSVIRLAEWGARVMCVNETEEIPA